MKIISNKKKLKKFILNEKNLGFVPTMGALHMGHISLIKKSISECKKTIVTIFINKGQFNNQNDYKKYPRKITSDIKILKKINPDYLYIPTNKEIYPNNINKKIKVHSFGKKLCGKHRPGHFKSVVDVIDRFIKIIYPKKIFLGNKDMQQLKLLEHYINQNYPKIKIIGCKTIREKSGLALSSRNFLLNKHNKLVASNVYKYLHKNKKNIIRGRIKLKTVRKTFIKFGIKKIDYIKIININSIIKPYKKRKNIKIFIAFFLGKIRLIDNV